MNTERNRFHAQRERAKKREKLSYGNGIGMGIRCCICKDEEAQCVQTLDETGNLQMCICCDCFTVTLGIAISITDENRNHYMKILQDAVAGGIK